MRRHKGSLIFLFIFLLLLVREIPVHASSRGEGIVVSDSPLATKAGTEILKAGGNAVDAAVATALALAVVGPASSGVGGGGFMVIYRSKEKKVHALDFRETAPAAAKKDHYTREGKVVSRLSRKGALAVAVPGQVAGLLEALKRFGSLSPARVIAPALRYATEGFPLGRPLRKAVKARLTSIRKSPGLARIFLGSDGSPPKLGAIIRQPGAWRDTQGRRPGGCGRLLQGGGSRGPLSMRSRKTGAS